MTVTTNAIHRPKVVSKMLGVSDSTRERMVAKGLLKKPIKLGSRSVGFLDSDIQEFLNKRIMERDNDSQ